MQLVFDRSARSRIASPNHPYRTLFHADPDRRSPASVLNRCLFRLSYGLADDHAPRMPRVAHRSTAVAVSGASILRMNATAEVLARLRLFASPMSPNLPAVDTALSAVCGLLRAAGLRFKIRWGRGRGSSWVRAHDRGRRRARRSRRVGATGFVSVEVRV